ncbi:hypothetical protein PUNSTDRAFT_28277, partial [Punctularia strigosozonata HHB-11173 SS5]|uniref:uncharacterized protein n=1 Tax=Punctularia strigosozonata (strain HHB-11173) TaxID=741275 RepID=UPI00044168FD
SDYVISSYTPSLSALLQANQDPPLDVLRQNGAAALLVAEPQPVGEEWESIPYTLAEVSGVKELIPSATLLGSIEEGATIQDFRSASVVHLACHGIQDGSDPLQSGFALRDGMLTVSRIMELDAPNAAVAFLSACESAMGDGGLPDESVHLAAAMLFLGFRSVVGTMWYVAMDDASGPKVAHQVYEAMLAGNRHGDFDYGCIPRALDLAMRELREDKETPIDDWALWIHMGI